MKINHQSVHASVARFAFGIVVFAHGAVLAQTAEELDRWSERLVELDSVDIAKGVKFRAGLEPPLYAFDADESKMTALGNPYEAVGKGAPGAAGWYRVTFVVPEKIGKFTIPKQGYNLGVESNVLGSWEIYTYNNGKPAGGAMAPTATGIWNKGNVIAASNQPPTAWVSNAPMPTKPGDTITVAILAKSLPLGSGSPEGFALRHLRLRWALAHTLGRQPFYAGLHEAAQKLRSLKGEELAALQGKLKGPVERLESVAKAADSGNLDELTKAMMAASREFRDALKR